MTCRARGRRDLRYRFQQVFSAVASRSWRRRAVWNLWI